MKRDVDGCPDLEVIAAFLDRRLGDPDRAAVAGHLSSCETCYFVFSEAAQIKPAPADGRQPDAELVDQQSHSLSVGGRRACRQPRRSCWPSPACSRLERSDAPEFTALVAAVGTDRTIEPRLDGWLSAWATARRLRSRATTHVDESDAGCADCRRRNRENYTSGQRIGSFAQARGMASRVVSDNRSLRCLPSRKPPPTRPLTRAS